jgi:serine/threonine protein kinase/dipeptidyl aminopeptidase/acylaminoacyl peptidase
MSPEVYRQAGELFDRFRHVPAGELGRALEAACSGNAELQAQVLRLIEDDRKAEGSFLENRAIEDAARLLIPRLPALPSAGTVIGHYRLGAQIGAGGMGVVYEARDLDLGRRVALKVLPISLEAESIERIQRFRREARAASLLNHPNIVSIFQADLDQGYYFIAMELVEGTTLRHLATQQPGLDAKTILDICSQIASALSAAHEAGIVHRDIKPENIMVRTDGFVKVLDFGLAKLREISSDAAYESELRTQPGRLAGTIQYLSPEQILGKPVGPRSDLFSLGVVIYELATGVRPFYGATEGAVFHAIVNRTPPPPSSLRPELGAELDSLILRALEKDPELRFQTAQDMRSVSRLLVRGSQLTSAPEIPVPPPVRARPAWWQLLLATLAGMALIGGLWFAERTPPDPLPTRFERMTFGPGEEIYPNLSPDGSQFIYASSARGKWDIYLQRVGGSTAINLTGDSTVDDTEPSLSRDGTKIAFRSERGDGGLFVMEATGENPRRIAARGHMPSWSPDGTAIVYCDDTFLMPNDRGAPGSRLHVLDLTTNTQRDLETGDAVQPNWSPHGQRIAYWSTEGGAGQRKIMTVPASGGTPVPASDDPGIDWSPVWAPSGQELYFLSDRGGTMNLWRIKINERTGKTSGSPEAVTTPALYMRFLSWSANGKKFLYSQSQDRISLSFIAFDKNRLQTVGDPMPAGGNFNIGNFSVSPDETRIVHDTVGDPTEDLWIVNMDGSGRRKLTSDSFRNRLPSWSPKGDEILFISTRSGSYQEWLVHPDGSGLRPLTAARNPVNAGVWIDGGRRIIASLFNLGLASLDPASPSPITDPKMLPGLEKLSHSYAFVSPPENGLLIGHINGSGENPVVQYSPAEGKLTKLGVRGTRPNWVPGWNNRYIVFLRDDACFLYDRQEKREKRLFSTPHNQMYFLQIGASGRRIYFSRTIRDAHVWMGELNR